MSRKITTLSDAAALVRPGATIALGGLTLFRRPVAFARALLACQPRPIGLTLLNFAAGFESDLLIGGGVVSRIRTCYCGLEVYGLAPMFSEYARTGALEIVEETELSLVLGIRAHLAGVSFMPGHGWLGTDLLRLRPDVRVIEDPYNPGESVVAFPAISWDVAVIHALKADSSGNALLNGNIALDIELALGAETVIITAEEIVDSFGSQPVHIAGSVVTAVAHAPRGASPTSCHPLYPVNGEEILRYIDACNAGAFDEYLTSLAAVAPGP